MCHYTGTVASGCCLVKPSKKLHITCITQTLRPRSFLLSTRIKGAKWCHLYILPQCLNRARHLQLLLHQKRGTAPASKRQDDIRVRGDSQTSDVFHGPAAETSRKRPLIDTSGADHETASAQACMRQGNLQSHSYGCKAFPAHQEDCFPKLATDYGQLRLGVAEGCRHTQRVSLLGAQLRGTGKTCSLQFYN